MDRNIFLGLPVLLMLTGMGSCTGTQAAYKEAEGLDEYAFVVTEHYSALVKEAADLAEKPSTPQNVKDALKAADRVANPIFTGDPGAVPPVSSLKELSQAYVAAKNAETQAALQTALDKAVRAVAGLINAIKKARAQTVDVEAEPIGATS